MKHKFFAHIIKHPISIEDAIKKFNSSQSSVYRWIKELKSEGVEIANSDNKVYIKTEKNYRICVDCKKELSLTEFYTNPQSRDGYLTHCRKCHVERYSEVDQRKVMKIKRYRKRVGLTLTKGSKLIGISQGYLSLLESGRQTIPEKTYKKIIKAYENHIGY